MSASLESRHLGLVATERSANFRLGASGCLTHRAIHASLLGDWAGQDRGISPDDVHAFADKLKVENKDADIKSYDGAKHAFINANNKDA